MNRAVLVGLILLAIAAAGTGGAVVYNMARGIRNKNPFNIRISGTAWQGKVTENTDGSFEQFSSYIYGIRAGVRILLTYKNKHGIKTVRQLINRFAPPTENDTGSYIDHVASAIGVSPDQQIDIEQHLLGLAKAIIKHENGFNPYSDGEIVNGIEAAYA